MSTNDELLDCTLPLEEMEEYQSAAVYFARFGKLPELISVNCFHFINIDLEAFMEEVNGCRYAIARGEHLPL